MGAPRRKAYHCEVFAQNDPHDVEVAMKYVPLGNLSPEYASKQSERVKKAKAKLDKLGIKIESIHYTQGYYDFVDIVDAPDPKHAGLRRKELRSGDQGRSRLSAG